MKIEERERLGLWQFREKGDTPWRFYVNSFSGDGKTAYCREWAAGSALCLSRARGIWLLVGGGSGRAGGIINGAIRERKGINMNAEKTKHTPGPWEVSESSNPKNGTAWRDIVSTGGHFSPSYVGEAMDGTHLDWILKGKKEEGEGGVMAGLVKYADWIIGGTLLAGWLVIVVVMVLS